MKNQMHILKLVYPPISNQEAEWLKDDPDVREMVKSSHIYMIGQRAESSYLIEEDALLQNFSRDLTINFRYLVGDKESKVTIDFKKLLKFRKFDIEKDLGGYSLYFEFGKKMIRIWRCDAETEEKIDVIDWFTTETILFDRWNNHPGISGLDNYRDFTKYYLHYVGISKADDSMTRLVVKPHDKRLRVLSNEYPFSTGSRLTDEMILFFFTIEPIRMSLIETEQDIEGLINGIEFDHLQITADAEKAFIKILDSQYNEQKYANYPKGSDGLYNTGLNSYCYLIGEDITLSTDTNEIAGDHFTENKLPKKADGIFINGDDVKLLKHENYT